MDKQRTLPKQDQDYVIKTQQISDVIGLSSKTVQRMEAAGHFPKRIILSKRQHGWLASDVYSWLEDRRA